MACWSDQIKKKWKGRAAPPSIQPISSSFFVLFYGWVHTAQENWRLSCSRVQTSDVVTCDGRMKTRDVLEQFNVLSLIPRQERSVQPPELKEEKDQWRSLKWRSLANNNRLFKSYFPFERIPSPTVQLKWAETEDEGGGTEELLRGGIIGFMEFVYKDTHQCTAALSCLV